MSVHITFLGHSGIVLSDGGSSLVIDPFLTGNPVAANNLADIRCNYVAVTHGHFDHLGDAAAIAKANDATVIANYEISEHLAANGVARTEPANIGGKVVTAFGWVALTQAFHSSSFDGKYMGMPCGLVVRIGGATLYHCGDTGLFSDMKLISEIYRPDVAFIPIGDRFTMGPELATRAAEFIRPKVAIPVHYATFPMLVQDSGGFRPKEIKVQALKPGESWTYNS